MNPRYRRLLIPGLLVVLIVVVLFTSLSREASGAKRLSAAEKPGHEVVSTISHKDIEESSGLVLSRKHDDLAYTINDSGNDPIVYAIKVSTGEVVGTTLIGGGELDDPEALSIDNTGTLWIADIGDNGDDRDDIALYALPEPGSGAHSVNARRYPLAYDKGPRNAETLLVNPKTNEKYIVSKTLSGGELFAVPESLKANEMNGLTRQAGNLPVLTTDGAFTPDGRYAVLRTLGEIQVFDVKGWELVRSDQAPSQQQGETLAMEADGDSILIGSEGENSELLRVALNIDQEEPDATAPVSPPKDKNQTDSEKNDNDWRQWAIVGVVLLVGAGLFRVLRRR